MSEVTDYWKPELEKADQEYRRLSARYNKLRQSHKELLRYLKDMHGWYQRDHDCEPISEVEETITRATTIEGTTP